MRRNGRLLYKAYEGESKTRFTPQSVAAQELGSSGFDVRWRTIVNVWNRSVRYRNLGRSAGNAQFLRDWQRVYICLRMRELAEAGVEIGPKHLKEFEAVELQTYRELVGNEFKASHWKLLGQIEDGIRAVKENRLDGHLGFEMEVRESEIPEEDRTFTHGEGLFVKKGKIPVGTVTGLVPGMVWQGFHKMARSWSHDTEGNPNEASPYVHRRRFNIENAIIDSDLERYGKLLKENATELELSTAESSYAQSMQKYLDKHNVTTGGTLAKAYKRAWLPLYRWWSYRGPFSRGHFPYLPAKEWAKRASFQKLMGLRSDHGFAKGHYVNHVGVHGEPNVMFVPVSIPTIFPAELLPYVPYKTDPASTIGLHGKYGGLLTTSRDTMLSIGTTCNLIMFGSAYKDQATMYKTQFLVMVPAIAVVALREIDEGEELLANHRFNPFYDIRAMYPSWYRPSPQLTTEDFLSNNLSPPKFNPVLKYAFGCPDPGVTLGDILKDPRYIGYGWMKRIARMFMKNDRR